jgi:hypothetical protein
MLTIHPAQPDDNPAIHRVHIQAFGQPQEGDLVDAMQTAGALTLSPAKFTLGRRLTLYIPSYYILFAFGESCVHLCTVIFKIFTNKWICLHAHVLTNNCWVCLHLHVQAISPFLPTNTALT